MVSQEWKHVQNLCGENLFKLESHDDLVGSNPLLDFADYQQQEPQTYFRILSIAIILQFCTKFSQLKVWIVDEGGCLKFVVDCPLLLADTTLVLENWFSNGLPDVDPMILGFESTLWNMRTYSTDYVSSVASVGLLLIVYPNPDEKYNITWRKYTT